MSSSLETVSTGKLAVESSAGPGGMPFTDLSHLCQISTELPWAQRRLWWSTEGQAIAGPGKKNSVRFRTCLAPIWHTWRWIPHESMASQFMMMTSSSPGQNTAFVTLKVPCGFCHLLFQHMSLTIDHIVALQIPARPELKEFLNKMFRLLDASTKLISPSVELLTASTHLPVHFTCCSSDMLHIWLPEQRWDLTPELTFKGCLSLSFHLLYLWKIAGKDF